MMLLAGIYYPEGYIIYLRDRGARQEGYVVFSVNSAFPAAYTKIGFVLSSTAEIVDNAEQSQTTSSTCGDAGRPCARLSRQIEYPVSSIYFHDIRHTIFDILL
jgi:hypothetical protein